MKITLNIRMYLYTLKVLTHSSGKMEFTLHTLSSTAFFCNEYRLKWLPFTLKREHFVSGRRWPRTGAGGTMYRWCRLWWGKRELIKAQRDSFCYCWLQYLQFSVQEERGAGKLKYRVPGNLIYDSVIVFISWCIKHQWVY